RELAVNTPCGPPSKLSISPASSAFRPIWSSLNCDSSSLIPCLAAKSCFDTIKNMPASDLALIRPWRQTLSCAAAGAASAQTSDAAARRPHADFGAMAIRIGGTPPVILYSGAFGRLYVQGNLNIKFTAEAFLREPRGASLGATSVT